MEDRYKLYDSVVMTVMTNVLVERERCGKFLLYDFHPEKDADKLYFNVSAIAADLQRENLYLDLSFWSYVKFKIKWRKRKNLKWFGFFSKRKLKDEHKTSVYILMNFIAEHLRVSDEIFKEINDTYYGWID